jgi:hypothetical protein
MINSLDELVQYSEDVAKASPSISQKLRIRRPGLQSDEIAALKKLLPGIPESYVSVVESVAIDGITYARLFSVVAKFNGKFFSA